MLTLDEVFVLFNLTEEHADEMVFIILGFSLGIIGKFDRSLSNFSLQILTDKG